MGLILYFLYGHGRNYSKKIDNHMRDYVAYKAGLFAKKSMGSKAIDMSERTLSAMIASICYLSQTHSSP